MSPEMAVQSEPTRPKLLVCLPYLTPSIGGGAITLLNLLESLAADGFEVKVVCFQERATHLIPQQFPQYLLEKQVGSAKYYFQYLQIIPAMARILKDARPDIILCNSYQPYWISLAARRLSSCKAALITGVQNNLTYMFKDAKWGRLRSYLTRLLEPRADCVIVPSKSICDQLVREFNIPQEKITVIPNAIRPDRIACLSKEPVDHEWFVRHDRPIILNVGVLDRQKDQGTLLDAFSLVRQAMPIRCVVLGDGPLREELERKAGQLGIANDVEFLGFQENPFKFMAKASVFVLSSVYEGGFGMVLVEAMACGCPVVSTRCPYGPEEILAEPNGDNFGLLVPVGDSKALAECIFQVLKNSSLHGHLSERGRLRANSFSAPYIASQYGSILRRLVGRPSCGSA